MSRLIVRCAPLVLVPALVACGASASGYEELCTRAENALSDGRVDEAWEAARTAVAGQPDASRAYLLLGRIGIEHDRGAEALELVDRRLADGQPTFDLVLVQGRLLVSIDRKRDAERSFREAIRLRPADRTPYLELASILGLGYRPQDALDLLLGAPPEVSDDPAVRIRAGALLARMHRYEEARTLLSAVVADAPESTSARFFLGSALLLTGDAEDARDALEVAVEQKPGFTLAWYQLAHAYERLGEPERRDEALRRFDALYRRPVGDGGEIR